MILCRCWPFQMSHWESKPRHRVEKANTLISGFHDILLTLTAASVEAIKGPKLPKSYSAVTQCRPAVDSMNLATSISGGFNSLKLWRFKRAHKRGNWESKGEAPSESGGKILIMRIGCSLRPCNWSWEHYHSHCSSGLAKACTPIKTHMVKVPPTPEYALTPILFDKIQSIIIRVV